MDVSQRRELSNDIFHRSSGSFELVLAPLLLGLIGFWLDHRAGTAPLFTIVFATAAVVGVVAKIFYVYRFSMAALAAAKADRARSEATKGEVASPGKVST